MTSNLNKLIIERIGITSNAIMKTNHIISHQIFPNRPYKFLWSNLLEIEELCEGNIKTISKDIIKPESIEINYEMNEVKLNNCKSSNIFNKTSTFVCNQQKIKIPIINASHETLAYYNCLLLNFTDIFIFNSSYTKPHTLFEMFIGKDYVKNYIMQENYGGGIYLEYHDNPHFHAPSNNKSAGFLTLGKKTESNKIEITGFRIPYGRGVFMPEGVYHNDCFLTGHWNVIYDNSNNYLTGLLKTKSNKMVEFLY
jgi:hypothetical protein